MSSTLTVLIQRLAEQLGDYWSSSASGDGAVGGTTLVDTALKQLTSQNDAFPDWYIRITSGTYVDNVRQINRTSGFTQSSGTVTPYAAFGGQILSAVTYQMTRYHPTDFYTRALHRASEMLYGFIWLPVRDESLVVGDLLTNGGFEASTYDSSWTTSGGTWTAETARVWHGAAAAKCVAAGADGTKTQNIFNALNIKEMAGKTLNIWPKIWASAASAGRIRVTFNGSTYTNGTWHGGDSEWETGSTLKLQVAIPTGATQCTVVLQCVDGNTVYFDDIRAWVDHIRRYTLPSTIPFRPYQVMMEDDSDDSQSHYSPLTRYNPPVLGRRLRILARNYVTQPATSSATMEVNNAQVDLLVARALQWIFETQGNRLASSLRAEAKEQAVYWSGQVKEILAMPGVKMASPSGSKPVMWDVEESGETKYLVLRD